MELPTPAAALPLQPYDVGMGLLFWHMHEAVVVGDAISGRIVLWNPAAETLFGYSADEIIGRPIEWLIPAPLKARHRAGLARYVATGHGPLLDRQQPVEVPAVHRNGEELTIELSLTPIPEARVPGCYVFALIRDVTERTHLARERAALLTTAEEYARRLEEVATLKADFTATLAHELSTPIATIRWFVELLLRDQLPAAERTPALMTIRTEVDLLRLLVEDLAAAARAEQDDFTVRPISVRLEPLLVDAVAFARTLPGDHPVHSDLTCDERVLADPERIAQVLRNLLSNAAKYSPSGSPIELRVDRAHGHVRIEVIDQGPGIAPDEREHIFTKFARGRGVTEQKIPGLGVGLYLSRRIVQAHGSELTVRSTPGQGATFGFTLAIAS